MADLPSSNWQAAFHWAFGDGFWYADPLDEVRGLTDDQLLWSPAQGIHCCLWHVGHIAHRERVHVAVLLQGCAEGDVIPARYGIFGLGVGYPTAGQLRESVGPLDDVKAWVRQVRQDSHRFIDSLDEPAFHAVPRSSCEGNSVAKVLMQTIGHTGLHIGRIQLLRRMIK
jgi:hypothetical protein